VEVVVESKIVTESILMLARDQSPNLAFHSLFLKDDSNQSDLIQPRKESKFRVLTVHSIHCWAPSGFQYSTKPA
jgi:hypothetical protein